MCLTTSQKFVMFNIIQQKVYVLQKHGENNYLFGLTWRLILLAHWALLHLYFVMQKIVKNLYKIEFSFDDREDKNVNMDQLKTWGYSLSLLTIPIYVFCFTIFTPIDLYSCSKQMKSIFLKPNPSRQILYFVSEGW